MANGKEAKTMEFPLSVNFYDILLRKGFDAGTNVTLSDGFGKDNTEAEFRVAFSDNVGKSVYDGGNHLLRLPFVMDGNRTADEQFAETFRDKMNQTISAFGKGVLQERLGADVAYNLVDAMRDANAEMFVRLAERERKTALFKFVKAQGFKCPIELDIDMRKWVKDPAKQGNDRRYLRVLIRGRDVTRMVANAIDQPMSRRKDAPNTMIVHGCGMDMFFWVQNTVSKKAARAGYDGMFHDHRYRDISFIRKTDDKRYEKIVNGLEM